MPAFILDCSVTLSWFMPGEQSKSTDDLLTLAAKDGAIVTGLWPLEMANVLLVAERRKHISQAQRRRALTALSHLPIQADGETAMRAWSSAFDLASAHDLTIYDAGYLELSLRSQLPLATLDHDLSKAALRCGVVVLGSSSP
jgi:predicted nucleic acid-binding protein